jgi:hypothetical protein
MAQITTSIEVIVGPRDRTSVLFRGILVVPTIIFLGLFSRNWSSQDTMVLGSGVIVAPTVVALVFRGVYPSYVYSFNRALLELSTRVAAYLFLLTDDYPSIEANSKISVEFPDVENGVKLNQFLPLVKWFLAIPLYLVGMVYVLYSLLTTILAWFITWTSGNYPDWAPAPVIATISYWNRVYGYAFILVTDEYPSFSL